MAYARVLRRTRGHRSPHDVIYDFVCHEGKRHYYRLHWPFEGKSSLTTLNELLDRAAEDLSIIVLMKDKEVRVKVVNYGQVDTLIRPQLVSIFSLG